MIISLGETLIDFISQKDLAFEGFPGEPPMNTSIAVAHLGVPCVFLSRISNDLFGNQLIDYLHSNSVGTILSQRTDDNTTLSFVQKQSEINKFTPLISFGNKKITRIFEAKNGFTLY